MESKHKMAIAGSGLVVAGIGLGIVGTALIAPAVFAWATGFLEKSADRLAARFGLGHFFAQASPGVGPVSLSGFATMIR